MNIWWPMEDTRRNSSLPCTMADRKSGWLFPVGPLTLNSSLFVVVPLSLNFSLFANDSNRFFESLIAPFSKGVILSATKSLGKLKNPGLDGFNKKFLVS